MTGDLRERVKSDLEIIGVRCAQVIADWSAKPQVDNAQSLRLVAEFAWALGATPYVTLPRISDRPLSPSVVSADSKGGEDALSRGAAGSGGNNK